MTHELTATINLNSSTLAKCWSLTLSDGRELCFAEHDADIICRDKIYVASNAAASSAIESKANLSADNLALTGVLNNPILRREDLLSGRYDNALVQVLLVDYMRPEQHGIILHQGHLGEVKMGDGYFIAEIKGVMQALASSIGEVFSPLCRASFCDDRCGLDVKRFTHHSMVTKVLDNQRLQGEGDLPDVHHFFTGGLLEFHTGAYAGFKAEVKNYYHAVIELALPPYNRINIDDKFSITQGCNKRFNTCVERYNNAKNFLGEPHLPGQQKLLRGG